MWFCSNVLSLRALHPRDWWGQRRGTLYGWIGLDTRTRSGLHQGMFIDTGITIQMVYVPWWCEGRQCLELHMVRKEGGKGEMAVNRTSTGNLQIFSRPFSSRVTGHRQQPMIHSLLKYVFLPPSFLTMCSSECCLSHMTVLCCNRLWCETRPYA